MLCAIMRMRALVWVGLMAACAGGGASRPPRDRAMDEHLLPPPPVPELAGVDGDTAYLVWSPGRATRWYGDRFTVGPDGVRRAGGGAFAQLERCGAGWLFVTADGVVLYAPTWLGELTPKAELPVLSGELRVAGAVASWRAEPRAAFPGASRVLVVPCDAARPARWGDVPTDREEPVVEALVPDPAGAVVTRGGGLLVTADGGASWRRVPLDGEAARALAVRDGKLVALTVRGERELGDAAVAEPPAEVDDAQLQRWRDRVLAFCEGQADRCGAPAAPGPQLVRTSAVTPLPEPVVRWGAVRSPRTSPTLGCEVDGAQPPLRDEAHASAAGIALELAEGELRWIGVDAQGAFRGGAPVGDQTISWCVPLAGDDERVIARCGDATDALLVLSDGRPARRVPLELPAELRGWGEALPLPGGGAVFTATLATGHLASHLDGDGRLTDVALFAGLVAPSAAATTAIWPAQRAGLPALAVESHEGPLVVTVWTHPPDGPRGERFELDEDLPVCDWPEGELGDRLQIRGRIYDRRGDGAPFCVRAIQGVWYYDAPAGAGTDVAYAPLQTFAWATGKAVVLEAQYGLYMKGTWEGAELVGLPGFPSQVPAGATPVRRCVWGTMRAPQR